MSNISNMLTAHWACTWGFICLHLSIYAFTILMVFSLTIYSIYYIFFHALSSVPGPFLAKVTNLWRYYHYLQGDFHSVQIRLFQEYGSSTIRIGPNSVIFSDAASYKAIHGHCRALERGDFYRMVRFADRGECSTFSAKENSLHQEKRKKLVSVAFTPKAISSYDQTVTKNINIWLQEIQKHTKETNPILDLAHLNKALTFDMMYEILVGESPKFQGMWTTPRFQTAVRHKEWTSRHGFGWGYFPIVATFLELIGSVTKRQFYKQKFDHAGQPILRTLIYWQQITRCEKILLPAAKQSKIGELKTTVMHKLVSLPENDSRKMRRDEEIVAEVRTLTFAGPGTTAAALTRVMYDLASHIDWQDKLRDEAKALFMESDLSSQESAPLLMAFIRESLRLNPADPLAFPLEVKSADGISLPGCDLILPRGTEVGALLYSVNRDKSVWGSNADEFNPERWLVNDEKQIRAMKEAWAVFGRGVRACVGHRIALNLIQKCIVGILHRWKITPHGRALKGRCNFEMAYSSCILQFDPVMETFMQIS